MIKVFIIIGIIILLLIALYLIYNTNNTIENFTGTTPETTPATTPATTPGTTPGTITATTPETITATTPGPITATPPETITATTPATIPGTTPGTTPATITATTPGTTPATTPATITATTPGTITATTPGTTAIISDTSAIATANANAANANLQAATNAANLADLKIATEASRQEEISRASSVVDFLSVILTYQPWGMYYAGNFADNKLNDMFNRVDRAAIGTGIITKSSIIGNGAAGNIESISGTIGTTIEWGANSIPNKFTICSISRYTGTTNNKRILTARNATISNDWIHGHKSGKRGVVYYNELKTNTTPDFNITGELTDWVVTCAKNDGEIPDNIYINGIKSGVKTGGQGGLKLAINKFDDSSIINEQSDYALSYVIIWDSCLSNKALKIVSDALINYLKSGEPLLYDMSSLTADDKIKVLDAKSNFIKSEFEEINNKWLLLQQQRNDPVNVSTTPTPIPATTIKSDDETLKGLFATIANLENNLSGQSTKLSIPTANIINLNNVTTTVDKSDVCKWYEDIPEPTEQSFTEIISNVPITSTNKNEYPYLWCKCDDNRKDAKICKAYDVCVQNYANNNKIDNKSTYTTIGTIDKQIYDYCGKLFVNFPKYLQTNTEAEKIIT